MNSCDFELLAPEAVPGVRLMPVVHDRIEIAMAVRLTLEGLQPDAVAVELPAPLHSSVIAAVDRLPQMSLVISEPAAARAVVWVCSPGDPFAEALRWARQRDRPVHLVDPGWEVEPASDPVPDPYAVWQLGPEQYLGLLSEALGQRQRDPAQAQREAGMAYLIQQLSQKRSGSLLVLLGAAHVEAVQKRLQRPVVQPLARLRRGRQEVRHLSPRSLTAVLPDPPLAHAAYELLRDGEVPQEVDLDEVVNRPKPLQRKGLRIIGGKPADPETRARRLAQFAARSAARKLGGRPFPDRRLVGRAIWKSAIESYRYQTQETIAPWQQRLYFDFLRRYCRLQGSLAGGLYELTVAARGVADDNLAWEVFEAARSYPWQQKEAEIPTVEIDGDYLDLGTRKIRFRRRFFRVKQRPVPVKRTSADDDPEDWLEGFDNPFICSYPPEDVVIEDYARFLQRKARALLSAEQKRSEPFTTSLLDGIDIRETLRNLHLGKVFVQEWGRIPGEAGSVVIIFDRDLEGTRYPHLVTWLGEHDQESDMAFYSTDPTRQVVGPGIMRATYGGLMMSYPPQRLYDVWNDPEYARAAEKAELLLLAAIDYSTQKLVVHLAAVPPSERARQYASKRGKRILHIPLGSMSPATLKKIRVVHMLAGHDKRQLARHYIW